MTRIRQFRDIPHSAALALLLLVAPAGAALAADTVATPTLAQLETGVDAEEAVRAVKRLQHTYGHYLEAGMWDDLADLFTDNATGQFGTETASGQVQKRRKKYYQSSAGLQQPEPDKKKKK